MPVYENGQIPRSALVSVQPGLYLTPLAAASWFRVVNGVAARYGWVVQLTDAYRPYSEQARIFNERYDPMSAGMGPYGDVRWWDHDGNGTKTRYVRMRGAAAAVPGTSNHGQATAVDVTGLGKFNSLKFNQFADVAEEHGWSNIEGRSVNEPWHWTKNSASFANNPTQTPGGIVIVIPPTTPIDPIEPEEEDDMAKWFPGFVVTYPGTRDRFLLSPDLTTKRHLHSDGDYLLLKSADVGAIENNNITTETIDAAAWDECHVIPWTK